MIRAAAIIATALVALSLTPVRAADAPPPDAHLAAALDLLEATNAKVTMMTMVDALTPVVLGQIRQQHKDLTDAALQRFQAAFREEITSGLDDLMKLTATIYEQHFSEEELHALAGSYRSDIGKKYIQTIPQIAKESLAVGGAWGREAGARAAQRAAERLKQEGINL
jgi:uncharacterized protein